MVDAGADRDLKHSRSRFLKNTPFTATARIQTKRCVDGAHRDFSGEGRHVEGELELGVGELAVIDLRGVRTHDGSGPLK